MKAFRNSREGYFSNSTSGKTQNFLHQNVQTCDSTGYIYDMNIYVSKDRQRAAHHLIATHPTVTNLIRSVEGFGHKLYMKNFLNSPELFDDLAKKNADWTAIS